MNAEAGVKVNTALTMSRFVVPFRYDLQAVESTATDPRYIELATSTDGSFRDRRAYLNNETASVMFQRTRWFRLGGDNSAESVLTCTPPADSLVQPFTVTLGAPVIVLFESAVVPPKGRRNPLMLGFLCRDAQFSTGLGDAAVTLDQVLWFNEVFRYLTCPHPRKAAERAAIHEPGILQSEGDLFGETWHRLLARPVEIDGKTYSLHRSSSWHRATTTGFAGRRAVPLRFEEHGDELLDGWRAYPDERAYVWTRVCTRQTWALPGPTGPVDRANPVASSCWVRLLNVDAPGRSPEVSAFEQEWAKQRTYSRWSSSGTYYGFSEHAGAMLAIGRENTDPRYFENFADMYFDLVLLLLYLRVVAFRFSSRLTELAAMELQADDERTVTASHELRRQFDVFTSLYRFPLISYQQQGIEMYSLARKIMDINDFVAELDRQMGGVNAAVTARSTEVMSRETVFLSRVALGFAFASLVGLAMQLAYDFRTWQLTKSPDSGYFNWLVRFLVLLFLAGIGLGWASKTFRRGHRTRKNGRP